MPVDDSPRVVLSPPGSIAAMPERDFGRREIAHIRSRFLALRDQRLGRLRASMTREQQDLLDLLPLLLHVNHPLLPGFVSTDTPAGISHYRPGRKELMLARRHGRSFDLKAHPPRRPPIRGLFLIGSSASLGQGPGSDLDIWLCHRGDLDPPARAALQVKLRNIESHARGLNLQMHFFPMHAEAFRDGRTSALSNESSGSTQHQLLLEEFYRSNILLAGSMPLWWLVPPERERAYTDFVSYLNDRHYIHPDEWLDFGGLHPIPAGEFFSAAHWQLYKAVESPYKALLKLMLLETFVSQWPDIDWACYDIKRALHGRTPLDPDALDPYRLVLQRISAHLLQHDAGARLHLARRALYFKAGIPLSRAVANPGWQRQQMLALTQAWGWETADLARLDGRNQWKLARVIEERNALAAELSHSYRLLTGFAQDHRSADRRSLDEVAMLGRKLYADLERRPGKIDRVQFGNAQDLHESTLWLQCDDTGPVCWRLSLEPPQRGNVTKSTTSLVEMLVWLYVNGIADHSSQIHLTPIERIAGSAEHTQVLRVLRKSLAPINRQAVDLPDLAHPARGRQSVVFIDVAIGPQNDDHIHTLDHLITTSWGEILVEHHADGEAGLLDTLCRHLGLFWPPDTTPAPALAAHCFSSPRAQVLVAEVRRLAQEAEECFATLGELARYYLRRGDTFFRIECGPRGFAWSEIGSEKDLFDHLGEAGPEFHPVRIQADGLRDSPLQLMMQISRPGEIQVFYRVAGGNIGVFVVDDSGALFRQWLARTQESYVLSQLARFFAALTSRRLVTEPLHAPPQVRFYRLACDSSGHWQAQPVEPPHGRAADYLEISLNTGGRNTWNRDFSLTVGNSEFSALTLGDRLYPAVAQYIRRLRRDGGDYPIYLTGMNMTPDMEQNPVGVVELLRFKALLERRLTQALANT